MMDGVGFIPWRLLDLVAILTLCGICLAAAPAFAAVWATGRRDPPITVRPSRAGRIFLGMWAISFFLAGAYFCLVKRLGSLVGGTTNNGEAGMAAADA